VPGESGVRHLPAGVRFVAGEYPLSLKVVVGRWPRVPGAGDPGPGLEVAPGVPQNRICPK